MKRTRFVMTLLFLSMLFLRHGRIEVDASSSDGTLLFTIIDYTTDIYAYDFASDSTSQITHSLDEDTPYINAGSADQSSDGRYISFSSESTTDIEPLLFVRDNETAVLTSLNGFSNARWSPVTNVFVSSIDGDLILYDGEHHEVTKTWHFPGSQGNATWSPDAHFIAFYSSVDIETGEELEALFSHPIYLMNVQTAETIRLTNESDACGIESEYRGLEWSPDGEMLALSVQCAVDRNATIYVIKLNGFLDRADWSPDQIEFQQLTLADNERHGIAGLTWSPNSEQIIFTNAPHEMNVEPRFYVVDVETALEHGAQVPELFLDYTEIAVSVSDPRWIAPQ